MSIMHDTTVLLASRGSAYQLLVEHKRGAAVIAPHPVSGGFWWAAQKHLGGSMVLDKMDLAAFLDP